MKTPLTFKPHGTHTSVILDADSSGLAIVGNDVAAELVALANSHAAQPGAPREDGVWDVLLPLGSVMTVRRKDGIYYHLNDCPVMTRLERILAHRKHVPFEMPKHEPLEVPNG